MRLMAFNYSNFRVDYADVWNDVPSIALKMDAAQTPPDAARKTYGFGATIRSKAGDLFDLPIKVFEVAVDGVIASEHKLFNLSPGSSDYVKASGIWSGFPSNPLNLPAGKYDIRFSTWEETAVPLVNRVGDSGWLIDAFELVGAVPPEEPVDEEPVDDKEPVVTPPVDKTLLETLSDTIKTLLNTPFFMAPVAIADLVGTYLGRAITAGDITEVTNKAVDIMPSLNFVSKSALGVDLHTGERSSVADVTEDEMVAAVLDTALAITGGKILATGFTALSEARAASVLSKIISNPSKLSASGQKYATYLRTASPLAGKLVQGTTTFNPKLSTSILSRLATQIRLKPYPMLIVGIIALSQLDVIGWGFDSLPKQIRDRQRDRYKTVQSLMFDLQDNLDAENYVGAKEIAVSIRDLFEEIELDLASRIPSFWENRGTSYEDIRAVVRGYRSALDALNDIYPQLAVDFDLSEVPEELRGTVSAVHDGDTFTLTADSAPRPSYKIRMLMLDTHESGTPAGVIEGDKLEELILNKPVVVLVDPYNQRGRYGRVLGVAVLESVEGVRNINHEMLQAFGTDILTDSKYHDKNKYIDWDATKVAASEAPAEAPEPRKPTLATTKRQFVQGYIQLDEMKREIAALGYSQKDQEDLIAEYVDARGKEVAKEEPEVPVEVPAAPPEVPTDGTGAIKVYSKPAYANIFLDSAYTNKLAIETLKGLSPGAHVVRLEVEGYIPLNITVDVKPGVTHEVRGELEKIEY